MEQKKSYHLITLFFGAFCWARTSDPLINSQML